MDAGLWTLDYGHWTLDPWRWTLDPGCYTLDAESSGHWALLLTVVEQNQNLVSDLTWLNYWKFVGCKSLRTSWSGLFCRDYKFWRGYFQKFYINVKCYAIKECQKKFLLWEIELHHKQLSWTVQKQPSTVIHFWKFLQKIPVVESFFWSNYRLTVQSSDYILKWLH